MRACDQRTRGTCGDLHIFALFLPFSCSSWHIFKAQNQILISYVKKLLILTGNLYSKLPMLNLKKLPGRLKSFKCSTCSVFFVSAKKGRPNEGLSNSCRVLFVERDEFGHLVCLWRRPKAAKANISNGTSVLVLTLCLNFTAVTFCTAFDVS